MTAVSFRAKREQLERVQRFAPECQGQNVALTVLDLPYLLDSGFGSMSDHVLDGRLEEIELAHRLPRRRPFAFSQFLDQNSVDYWSWTPFLDPQKRVPNPFFWHPDPGPHKKSVKCLTMFLTAVSRRSTLSIASSRGDRNIRAVTVFRPETGRCQPPFMDPDLCISSKVEKMRSLFWQHQWVILPKLSP